MQYTVSYNTFPCDMRGNPEIAQTIPFAIVDCDEESIKNACGPERDEDHYCDYAPTTNANSSNLPLYSQDQLEQVYRFP